MHFLGRMLAILLDRAHKTLGHCDIPGRVSGFNVFNLRFFVFCLLTKVGARLPVPRNNGNLAAL